MKYIKYYCVLLAEKLGWLSDVDEQLVKAYIQNEKP